MADRRRHSRLSPRRPSGALLWAAVLLVFAGVIVPLIHANRFRARIQTALETSLGRKVEIGEVTLQLLTGPGFQLHNVIIGEDPAFGIEHFAYMDEMQVRLRLRTLWTGQLQFASLTLVNPSINLVKNPQGHWNFETLLDRARQVAPPAALTAQAPSPRGPRPEVAAIARRSPATVEPDEAPVPETAGAAASRHAVQPDAIASPGSATSRGDSNVTPARANAPPRAARPQWIASSEVAAASTASSAGFHAAAARDDSTSRLGSAPVPDVLAAATGEDRRATMRPYFPYIGVQDGRVNFKFGDYKSAFYFQDVEAALSPARDAEARWEIRFAGRPARTDRLLSGMGRLSGEGELATARHQLRLDLALDVSPLEYLLTLVYGRDFGLHGEIGARARVSGAVSALHVQGMLEASDVHRWDLLPAPDTRFTIPFLGRLDLPQQRLELATDASVSEPAPVRVQLAVSHYLSDPQWSAAVAFRRAPADPLLDTARHLGAALPAGLRLRGDLNGHLDFSESPWPQGALQLEHGQVLLPGVPSIALGPAGCNLQGGAFEVAPFDAHLGDPRLGREVVEVSATGRLDGFSLDARLAARGLRLEAARTHLHAIKPGWLASLTAGVWDGRLVYRKRPGQPGEWSGEGTLSKARWQPSGLESPVEIARARLRFDSGALRLDSITGSLGETSFAGTCRRSLPAASPAASLLAATARAAVASSGPEDSCRIRVSQVDLDLIDNWLNPQQKPSRWEIWRRALGRTSPEAPSWLKGAHITGSVTVANLRLGKWTFHNVQSDVAWAGETLQLNGLHADLGSGQPVSASPGKVIPGASDSAPASLINNPPGKPSSGKGSSGRGSVNGSLRVDLSGSEPKYGLQAAVRGADLKNLSGLAALPANFERGAVDLDFNLSTAGRTARDLRAALQISGTFEGRSISLHKVAWSRAAIRSNAAGAAHSVSAATVPSAVTSGRTAANSDDSGSASGSGSAGSAGFGGAANSTDLAGGVDSAIGAGATGGDDDPEDAVEIRSLLGRFDWSRSGLEMTGLRMVVGQDVYQGRGSIGGRAGVLIDLVSRGRQSRLASSAAVRPQRRSPNPPEAAIRVP